MTRRHSHETIKLPRWLRWSIYAVTTILTLTGMIWLLAHYGLRKAGSLEETHPLEPWMMKLHGLAVMVSLFLYGSLLRSHMIKAWHARMNRNTGLITLIILGWLAISGYLLYYAGNEEIRSFISISHWTIGLLVALALPLHIWYGRNPKRRKRKPITA